MKRLIAYPYILALVCSLCLTPITQASASQSENGSFKKLGTFTALGGLKGAVVGPGSKKDSSRLYLDYMYSGSTLEIVSVDPKTGQTKVFKNPTTNETGSYGLINGPDGNMYMGTLPHAHLLRLNTKQQKLEDLGVPIAGEKYIWDLTATKDNKIYGVTFPNCKLFSYNTITGETIGLGRMDPDEQYARFIVAGNDGYLYISIGTVHSGVIAYNIATKKFRQIIPNVYRGRNFYHTYRGADENVYSTWQNNAFQLKSGEASKLPRGEKPPKASSTLALPDGSFVHFSGTNEQRHIGTTIHGSQTLISPVPYLYKGREANIFRLTVGPNGIIFGSGALPLYFFSFDVNTGKFTNLGQWGGGETYSLLTHHGKMLLANYSAHSVLMSYDPTKPIKSGYHLGNNPRYVSFKGADTAWRPLAMIAGKDEKIYIGAIAGYGVLGGSLTIWDPSSNDVQTFNDPVPGQSVVSLAEDKNGIIYGGTSIGGGGGTIPVEKSAVLFTFDESSKEIKSAITPVPDAALITNLIVAPNGHLFGFAGRTLFEYIPAKRTVKQLSTVSYGTLLYNTIATGPDGNLYGLASKGIFRLNPNDGEISLIARSPEPITSGGALVGDNFYFGSAASIYRYKLPPPVRLSATTTIPRAD